MQDLLRNLSCAVGTGLFALAISASTAHAQTTLSAPLDFLTDDLDAPNTSPPPTTEMPTCKAGLDKPIVKMSALVPLQPPPALPPVRLDYEAPIDASYALAKGEAGFSIDFPNLMVPIRQPSSSAEVTDLLRSKAQFKTLKDEREFIKALVMQKNYAAAKYYKINNGFSVLLPYEMINDQGIPLSGDSRWALAKQPCNSFYSYTQGFFNGVYGRLRAILIIVGDGMEIQSLSAGTAQIEEVKQFPDFSGPPKRVFIAVYEGNVDNRGEVSHLKQASLPIGSHIHSLF